MILEKDDTLPKLRNADIIVTDCDIFLPYIDKLPSLKWAQTTWAGVDKLVSNLQDKKVNYVLTRFSDEAFGLAMSEYVIAHIFNFERDRSETAI